MAKSRRVGSSTSKRAMQTRGSTAHRRKLNGRETTVARGGVSASSSVGKVALGVWFMVGPYTVRPSLPDVQVGMGADLKCGRVIFA